MAVDEERRRLRVAVVRGDGDLVRYLDHDPWPEHRLQLIGEGLSLPLGTGVAGAPEHPGLLERWFAFSDERLRGRARAWLSEQGYAALPRRHDLDPVADQRPDSP